MNNKLKQKKGFSEVVFVDWNFLPRSAAQLSIEISSKYTPLRYYVRHMWASIKIMQQHSFQFQKSNFKMNNTLNQKKRFSKVVFVDWNFLPRSAAQLSIENSSKHTPLRFYVRHMWASIKTMQQHSFQFQKIEFQNE